MVIKVHSAGASTCGQRVLTTLHEKGVPFELVPVDFSSGAHKKPPHINLQPFGKVPVLEDDGFFVYESRAICKYIAKKYAGQGTKLIPEDGDLKGYALFEQACSIEQCYFTPPAEAIAFEKVFKTYYPGLGPTDEAEVQKRAAELEKNMAVYETILSKQSYLSGEELSLADLFVLPYVKILKSVGFKEIFDKFPHVAKWLEGLEARDSWVKVIS
ncbi:putative glutathione S-transferase [Venustampulla echinocandica]|uniref:glutathione transferase n=1 Tax=Venustampulla echinocandica TaxID=2656787 RepID=A0A370TW81_9HELO|nr:putative glutathione S-transferase [Venustampulla echinocandica]RDL39777.1 putative glutathione S-transferase [Venustampulla echinocandica]